MKSNGSRWGVKGSNEVSDGLSAVYRYEESLDLTSASLSTGNRLSYVGLSGGFGSVTLGRVFSASYNHVGVLTDYGVASTNEASTVRTSNTVSYSASTGPVSFQLDANMESGAFGNTESVDSAELGISFDTGAATVGLAFIDQNTESGKLKKSAIGFSIPVGGLTLYASHTGITTQIDAVAAMKPKIECAVYTINKSRFVKTQEVSNDSYELDVTKCPEDVDPGGKVKGGSIVTDGRRYRFTKVISVGSKAVEAETSKTKSVHAGVSGSLGDTGMSFAVNFADHSDKPNGDGENPWNAHVSKSLGGGANLAFEYIDNDSEKTKNQALVHLKVDF